MQKILSLGIAAGLLIAACAANALPTALGPSGGFLVPTTEIASGYTLMIDRFEGEYSKYPNTTLVAGISDNLEIGLDYQQDDEFQFGPDIWNVNAKFLLPIGSEANNVAVGAAYGNFWPWFTPQYGTGLTAYIAADMQAFGDITVTGNISLVNNTDYNETIWMLALAAEKPFSNGTAIGAEFISGFGWDSGTIYVKMPVNDCLTARAGLGGIGDETYVDFGFAYGF